MLRAALHALCDPVAGLPKGISMTQQPLEQLAAVARAAAPALLSPAAAALPSSFHQGAQSVRVLLMCVACFSVLCALAKMML